MKMHWDFFSAESEQIRGQLTEAAVDAKVARGEGELVSFNPPQSTIDLDILIENACPKTWFWLIELFSSPINFNTNRTFASSMNPWMRKNFIKVILMRAMKVLMKITIFQSRWKWCAIRGINVEFRLNYAIKSVVKRNTRKFYMR